MQDDGTKPGYAAADGYEVVDDWRCVPECPVARLGAQSGESSSTGGTPERGRIFNGTGADPMWNYGDTGTAARFFFQADYALERLADADPLFYTPKASRAEREAGLDPRTVAFMRAIEGDDGDDAPVFDGSSKGVRFSQNTRQCSVCGTRAKQSGPHGRWPDCEHDNWEWVPQHFNETTVDDGRPTPIDNPYQRGETKRRNPHPTVKPLSLARYLATLLLPPDRYAPRRLLVPFAGVASEMIGAMLAGWEEVLGIELDDDGTHIPVAEARIAYWLQRRAELSDPSKPIEVNIAAVQDGQLDMFGGG